jgi:ankyrin repeat protein
VAKIPGKKAKSSTKKKDLEPQDLVDKRADLFSQLDAVGGQVAAAAGGLPPIDGYTASVDLDSETESNHDTALTLACAGGHEELVKLLLERGADIGEVCHQVALISA